MSFDSWGEDVFVRWMSWSPVGKEWSARKSRLEFCGFFLLLLSSFPCPQGCGLVGSIGGQWAVGLG